jgi:predicted nuclease with TOPRIM domain
MPKTVLVPATEKQRLQKRISEAEADVESAKDDLSRAQNRLDELESELKALEGKEPHKAPVEINGLTVFNITNLKVTAEILGYEIEVLSLSKYDAEKFTFVAFDHDRKCILQAHSGKKHPHWTDAILECVVLAGIGTPQPRPPTLGKARRVIDIIPTATFSH